MKKIAIITARGGSKGLPNKNMLMVDGKPLLAYSIEAALAANIFDRIVLTTDSQEYIDFLSSYPIDFIRRADHLATDRASSFDVLEDVLTRDEYRTADYFVLLQPTSPLRTARHITEATERFEAHFDSFDYLVSVSDAHKPTTLTRQIDEDESLKYFDLDYSRYARQNYAPEYSPNGALFLAKPTEYLETKQFYGARSLAYFMDKNVSIDIDDRDDFEYFYSVMQKRKRAELLRSIASREAEIKSSVMAQPADITFMGGSLLAQYPGRKCRHLNIQNLAIISSTAPWYDELILSSTSPLELSPTIVVALGQDDLRYDDAEVELVAGAILKTIQRIKSLAPSSPIYVLECLKGLFRVDLKNSDVERLNAILCQEIVNDPQLRWVETNVQLVDQYGKLGQSYTHDGLNLNAAGYCRLEDIIYCATQR